MSHCTDSVEAEEDPAERGQRRPPSIQMKSDDPFDVDARRLGQVGVVGHGPHGRADPGPLQEQADGAQHDEGGDDDGHDVLGEDADAEVLDRLLAGVPRIGAGAPVEEDRIR